METPLSIGLEEAFRLEKNASIVRNISLNYGVNAASMAQLN